MRHAQAVRHVVQGQRLPTVSAALALTSAALRKWVERFASHGTQGCVERPRSGRPPKSTCALAPHLHRLVAPAPSQPGSHYSPWRGRALAPVVAHQTGVHLGRASVRGACKKRLSAPTAPPGRRAPNSADLASGSVALAALESRARRGDSIGLSEDATILWRCALPRASWWRTAPRARLPTRPLHPSQIKRAERLTRPAWGHSRSWSRRTRGVRRSVLGARQDGTSTVFYTSVPPCAAQAWRPYLHHIMAPFRTTGTEVVMGGERSGLQRAHQLAATLDHAHGTVRFQSFPAHGGHHLNPIEGFWRVRKDALGAGRCFPDLHQLYQRTRHVLMAHQERPIYAFHW